VEVGSILVKAAYKFPAAPPCLSHANRRGATVMVDLGRAGREDKIDAVGVSRWVLAVRLGVEASSSAPKAPDRTELANGVCVG